MPLLVNLLRDQLDLCAGCEGVRDVVDFPEKLGDAVPPIASYRKRKELALVLA